MHNQPFGAFYFFWQVTIIMAGMDYITLEACQIFQAICINSYVEAILLWGIKHASGMVYGHGLG